MISKVENVLSIKIWSIQILQRMNKMSNINYIVTSDWGDTYTITNTNNITKPTGVAITSDNYSHGVSFSSMLNSLICDGLRASRSSWHRCVYIKVQLPDEYSRRERPYIYITKSPYGEHVLWLPSFEDLFAKDWVVFK